MNLLVSQHAAVARLSVNANSYWSTAMQAVCGCWDRRLKTEVWRSDGSRLGVGRGCKRIHPLCEEEGGEGGGGDEQPCSCEPTDSLS